MTIAVLLGIGAAAGGLSYWKRATAGGQPFYYQNYFEPAVMIACGKGFVVARPQVDAMVPFLWRQADRFSCDAIPANAPLGTHDMFQLGSWRYLMLVVGWTWRVFGVAWSALGPLFALLFGATAAALYLLFRLAVAPVVALAGAVWLCFSQMHLLFLLVLRDYTKAPFTLALIVLLGLIVTGRPTWRRLMAIGAAYGVLLGIGYGFRTDFISDVPPFFITLFLFAEGGVLENLAPKLAGTAACVIAGLLAGWPVISTLPQSRPGCEWHVVVLGFANAFDGRLGVSPAPYEVNRQYLDEYAYANVTSYARRVAPGIGHIEYCEAEYGRWTRAYAMDVLRRFPADVIVRAYASVLRIVELPFTDKANEDIDVQVASSPLYGVGLPLVVLTVLLIGARDFRLGLFATFFLLYFGGVQGTQFDARHFFHLEFIGVWAVVFLAQSAVLYAPATLLGRRRLPVDAVGLRRSAIALGTCVVALAVVLWVARAYQQSTTRALLASYLAAPREAVAPESVRSAPHADPEVADLVVVDLNGPACRPQTQISFAYDAKNRAQFSRTFDLDPGARATGLTHIIMPVYEGFGAVKIADAPAGCLQGVYRVRDPAQFSMLVEAQLPPAWRRAPLYQRLRGWLHTHG